MDVRRGQRQSILVVSLLMVSQVQASAQGGYPKGGAAVPYQEQQANDWQFQSGQLGQGPGNQGGGNPNVRGTDPAAIRDWFAKYDMVRRQAQMSPSERNKADDLLSHGLQLFVPGEEKVIAHNLLTELVSKYDRACGQLKALPYYPETSSLHRQYFQYFSEAKNLFTDYLRVQNNVMTKDAQGNSVMAGLIARKGNLEGTEQQAKALDAQLRNRLGIPPYRF